MKDYVLFHVFRNPSIIVDRIKTNGLRHRSFFWPWAETQNSSHVGVIVRDKRVFICMISYELVRVDTSGFKIVINRNHCLVMVKDMSMSSSSRTCTAAITATYL